MSSGRSSRTIARVAWTSSQLLAAVPELEEEPDAHPVPAKPSHRRARLVHRDSLLHRVQDALRAGLGAEPHLRCAGAARAATFSSVMRSARVWQRKGVRRPASTIVSDQATSQRDLRPEDVVAEPEVVGRVSLAQEPHLRDDAARASGCGTCCRRLASRTSCRDTGTRASSRRSARSSRVAASRTRGSARCRRGPRPAAGARRGPGGACGARCAEEAAVQERRPGTDVAASLHAWRSPRSRSTRGARRASPRPLRR